MSRSKSTSSTKPAKVKKQHRPTWAQGCITIVYWNDGVGIGVNFGMHFASGSIADMSFLVGASSLTMGALWLVTSDFGFSKPSMGISIGGASIVAIASGALVFGGGETVEQKQLWKNPYRGFADCRCSQC